MKTKIQCQYCDAMFEPDEDKEEIKYCSVDCYERFLSLRGQIIYCEYCDKGIANAVDIVPAGRYTQVASCLACFNFLAHQVGYSSFHERKGLIQHMVDNLMAR